MNEVSLDRLSREQFEGEALTKQPHKCTIKLKMIISMEKTFQQRVMHLSLVFMGVHVRHIDFLIVNLLAT